MTFWMRWALVAALISGIAACSDETGGDSAAGDPVAAADGAGDGVEQPADGVEQPADGVEQPTGGGADGVEDPVVDPDDTELRIESIEPGVGRAKGADVITVLGNGFVDGQTAVFFGVSAAIDVFVINATRLTATTPPGNPGLVDVTVSIPSLETTARLEGAYRYQSDMLIVSLEPSAGNISGGEPVTISGSGFSQGQATVLFGDRKAIDVQVLDDATIHATTPQGTAVGLVDVHVSTDQGLTKLDKGFAYYETPSITAIMPAAGPVEGATEVTLIGRGFDADTVVRFGEGESPKITFVSDTELTAITPPGTDGTVSVTVETQYGFGGLPDGFTYLDAEPVAGVAIVSVQPAKGTIGGGNQVYVTAYGLTDDTDTTVLIGGSVATLVLVDSKLLTAVVEAPAGSVGIVDVTVSSSEGEDTLAGAYQYIDGLAVTAVNPLSGPVEGGDVISVFGNGFTEAADVRVGALPCGDVTVLNAKTIECITPQGSPGGADVIVTQGQNTAVLPAGYFYESGQTEVFVVDPDTGSQAGGTYVRLLGSGFTAPATVRFNGTKATHVKVINSTLITAKTPPGEIGVSDVTVEVAGFEAPLFDSFTYFDPVALYGGTWGPGVEGAVNITVLDGGDGSPIPDVFVILAVDPDTPYQGFTNGEGQVTFSGQDVLGEQMVSASKDGYASNSVVEFNATNITIYLTPQTPPSMGPPPPGATVSGTISGLGKYVLVPPGLCSGKFPQPGEQCAVCTTATDCTGLTAKECTPLTDQGSVCTQACAADSDCDIGYSCINVTGPDQPQCIPSPGTKEARCYFTMGANLPESHDPYIVPEDGAFTIPSRLGEVAIVCLGGVKAWGNPDNSSNFTAYAFGVRRHLLVQPGPNEAGDITLNHPLSRDVRVRLDSPPQDPSGPNVSVVQIYWDFGSDGMFFHPTFVDAAYMFGNDDVSHTVRRQPPAWTGDVYDVRWQILAGAINFQGPGMSQDPQSLTILTNLKEIETDNAYNLGAGQWDAIESGVTRTVNALHGFDDTNIWGVGEQGGILHFGGLGWGLQASPTKNNLYGVWGAATDDAWAVGDDGAVLRFDGAVWNETAFPSPTADLTGVWGASATNIFVVARNYAGTWRWDGTTWINQSVPGADLRDIHGADANNVWAVGRYGSIRYFNGESWTTQAAGGSFKDLFSVHAVSPTEAYAVGAGGTLLKWDGIAWATMPSPTERTLRAVWANGPNDVYAVGDGTVLLHYDGIEWADQTIPAKVSYASLLALWGNPATSNGVALGTGEVLMGPLLQVPQDQTPEDGGVMPGFDVSFGVKPGVEAKYNVVEIFIPTPFGDSPIWNITTDGTVFDFELPDFANIEGTPGIPAGSYGLRIMRGWNENFDIDNYDNFDFNPRSWSIDTIFFTK
ncbi:MAG: hypothetical protein ACI9WU_001950 [Myxococcota bacterium]|jgi:hypothetical protein